MAYSITVLKGDGIGPEIVASTQRVLEATGISFVWEEALAGEEAVKKVGEPIPDEAIELIKKNKIAIKGPMTNLVAKGWPSPNQTLRTKLGFFAAVKRAKAFEGVPTPYPGTDLIVIREAGEDTYAGAEQQVGPDAAVAFKFITRKTTHNVARFAFDLARTMNRKKITVALKANILKLTDGLFLKGSQEIAAEYPDIVFESKQIDAVAYELVKDPYLFDMILAPNVYGDILADEIAGVAGSLGLGFGGNFGHDYCLLEPVHGTAPSIAGQGLANPIGEILSGAMLLDCLKEHDAAKAVENAVAQVLKEGEVRTGDLGGKHGTEDMTQAIIKALKC